MSLRISRCSGCRTAFAAGNPEAWPLEVLFLERGEYPLMDRWQPDGQAVSRLLEGFKATVRELFGSAASVKGEN